ncbi:MAG TPA: helix-turn-helix domain-containing protein [Candidatus Dormibacteraeota bacterium]
MGLARYVVGAVLLEGRSPTELARSHGISRSWIYELLHRFRDGGYEALEPRSRRPHGCSHQVSPEVQAIILGLRQELVAAGHDAGARTLAHHLQTRVAQVPSVTTIWRILCRSGLVVPQPRKRPKSSFHRFQAQLPNELWQLDITYWRLSGGRHVEVLNLVDDHSRLLLASEAFFTTKAADVVEAFLSAGETYGFPAALLTDNAAVFAGRSRRGKVLLESELDRLGIACKHSQPNHPQTCGKVCEHHVGVATGSA